MITMKLQDVAKIRHTIKNAKLDGLCIVDIDKYMVQSGDEIGYVASDGQYHYVNENTEVQVELIDYDSEIAKLIETKAKLDNWLKSKGYENDNNEVARCI